MPANTRKVTDLQFAFSAINNTNNGTIDFQEVADECGMSSKVAASCKFFRMKKAQTISPGGSAGAASPGDEGTPGAEGTPEKAKKAASKKATPSKKRKLDDDDKETEHEVEGITDEDGEELLS
ncbi:hypothetical protein LTR85_000623 [Meristemomyces frigidus]|nr:hypothetical protein LTR85_000623 [Meristemomyces frigidus]